MAAVYDSQGNYLYDDGSGTTTTYSPSTWQDPGVTVNPPAYDPSQGVDLSQFLGNGQGGAANFGNNNTSQQTGGIDYSQYLNAGGPSWLQQLQGYGGSGNALGSLGSILGMNGGSGGSSGSSGLGSLLGGLSSAVGGSGNLGALGGALAGYLGSKNPLTGSQTSSSNANSTQNQTTSQSNVPSWAMPYYQQNVQNAQNLMNQGFNSTQQQAFGNINNLAQNDPYSANTQKLTNDTLSGQYLDPTTNPYLAKTASAMGQQMADAYARGTGAQTMAQFQKNGAYGGSAMQETQAANNQAFGNSLGNAMNSLYGGNYSQERSNQLNTLNNTPALTQNLYTGANNQLAIGNQQQNLGYQNQQMFGNTLAGLNGIQTSGTQTGTNTGAQTGSQNASQSQNPYAALLGGGITGYGLGNVLGGAKSMFGSN